MGTTADSGKEAIAGCDGYRDPIGNCRQLARGDCDLNRRVMSMAPRLVDFRQFSGPALGESGGCQDSAIPRLGDA